MASKLGVALVALVTLVTALASRTANAALITTLAGNDCTGVFGEPFDECRVPSLYDPSESPVVIKFTAELAVEEINLALFPSIDGSEFTFSDLGQANSIGTWTYTAGPGDPVITFFVAKSSTNFNLFSYAGAAGPPQSDSWITPLDLLGAPRELSHLTFYDTGGESPDVVPEPGALLLLGTGLVAMGASLRWRRKH